MSWTIRKPGQGYWTRLLTGVGAGLLVLFGAMWLWDTLSGYGVYAQAIAAVLPIALFGLLIFRWVGAKDRTVDFLIETDDEMKQVNWPSQREVIGSTIVVIVTISLLVALLFDADQMFADLFAAAGVLQFGEGSIILGGLGWPTPTVWVLAGVGLAAALFAVVRFAAVKYLVTKRLGLDQPPATGMRVNVAMQTALVGWLVFHAAALIGGLTSIPALTALEQSGRIVSIAIWALAAAAVVCLGVGIDHVTLRQHGDHGSTIHRHGAAARQQGPFNASAVLGEVTANAASLAVAWAALQVVAIQAAG
jgi:preprotein translocase SecE subunit